jgi:hypothetical protein
MKLRMNQRKLYQYFVKSNVDHETLIILAKSAKNLAGNGKFKTKRWKSLRIKIHRLGYRFVKIFKSIPYGYGMIFSLEIPNIWQKSGDFWFADFFLEIDMDFPKDF